MKIPYNTVLCSIWTSSEFCEICNSFAAKELDKECAMIEGIHYLVIAWDHHFCSKDYHVSLGKFKIWRSKVAMIRALLTVSLVV